MSPEIGAEDGGLQAERTELAWRRTLLALAAASLVSMRALSPVLGAWAVVPGIGGAAVAALLRVPVDRRHRRVRAVLGGIRAKSGMPGAGPLLAIAALTSAGAALAALVALRA